MVQPARPKHAKKKSTAKVKPAGHSKDESEKSKRIKRVKPR